jgi:hypothetical protein
MVELTEGTNPSAVHDSAETPEPARLPTSRIGHHIFLSRIAYKLLDLTQAVEPTPASEISRTSQSVITKERTYYDQVIECHMISGSNRRL